MTSFTLYGSNAVQTEITTDVLRQVGRRPHYQATVRCWAITGRHEKRAGALPFLTSARAAREWIREQEVRESRRDDLAADDGEGVR